MESLTRSASRLSLRKQRTIAEILTDEKQFSKVSRLIEKVGGLQSQLGDSEANCTFLAPTNEAIENFEKVVKHYDSYRGNRGREVPSMEEILEYHVIQGVYEEKDLFDGMLVESNLRANVGGGKKNYQKIRVSHRLGGWTLNMFTHLSSATHEQATNGVIFAIDSVLIPPADVMEVSFNLPMFASTWSSAVYQTNLEKELTQQKDGATIFLPTNAAWDEMNFTDLMYLFSPYGMSDLKKILEYHIVPELEYGVDMIKEEGKKFSIRTLLKGEEIKIKVGRKPQTEHQSFSRDHDMHPLDYRFILNEGEASIKFTDILASNGTLHVINAVLIPPSVILPSMKLERGGRSEHDSRRRRGRKYIDDDEW